MPVLYCCCRELVGRYKGATNLATGTLITFVRFYQLPLSYSLMDEIGKQHR
jgi:hypothetical protein